MIPPPLASSATSRQTQMFFSSNDNSSGTAWASPGHAALRRSQQEVGG